MPIRTFAAYERPSSADFNRYFMQQMHVIKASNESVTSSTTLQDDDELFFSVTANTDYWMVCLILYQASTAGDLKGTWSAPSGSTLDWVSDALGSSATASIGSVSRTHQTLATTGQPGGFGAFDGVAICKGLLSIGSTAGTFRFRWAQLASDATATQVRSGSMVTLRRLTS